VIFASCHLLRFDDPVMQCQIAGWPIFLLLYSLWLNVCIPVILFAFSVATFDPYTSLSYYFLLCCSTYLDDMILFMWFSQYTRIHDNSLHDPVHTLQTGCADLGLAGHLCLADKLNSNS
jgi:hypothetical protein